MFKGYGTVRTYFSCSKLEKIFLFVFVVLLNGCFTAFSLLFHTKSKNNHFKLSVSTTTLLVDKKIIVFWVFI